MTVNARRPRRASSAAAEADVTSAPEHATKPSRRRGSANDRIVAFPEPEPAAYSTPAPTLTPLAAVPRVEHATAATPAAAPVAEVPREAPAVLHPSDRRGFSAAPPAARYSSSVDQLAIGEIDQTLFDCPSCRRPLALGARRCPGCKSLLIRSVLLRKAAMFVAAGALMGAVAGLGGGVVIGSGLAAGAGAGVVATASGQPAVPSAPSAVASQAATREPTPEPTATPEVTAPPPTAVSMPVAVQSALANVLSTNAKLATAETDLRSALAAHTFDASAVAATLRTVSAQSLYGSQLAGPVGAWSGGSDLGAQLATFYGALHDGATAALDNSVQNVAAYKAAAKSMADLLDGRTAIDDAIVGAASAAGVTLPGSTTP